MATGSADKVVGRHVVDAVSEFPPGSRRIITLQGRSIGILNVEGSFYAMRNVCPHHGAPLCKGEVLGTMLPSDPHEYRYSTKEEHRTIRCPWHGFQFRLEDGRGLVKPERSRVKVYPVAIEDGEVVLYTGRGSD